MQGNQNVSKNQTEKRNRDLVFKNLSCCHSDCHRAVAFTLLNAERLQHVIGWQVPSGQCKCCVLSRHLKFILRIHHFLSDHIYLIWAKGKWVAQSSKFKRKFEYLLQSIWWPSLIIFKDAFFLKVAQKH